MKKKLFLLNQFSNMSTEEKPISPVSEAEKDTSGFVADKYVSYKLNEERKRLDIWIFGVIQSISQFTKVISLFHTLTEEYKIIIHLHTPGGSIDVTDHILTAMSRCKAEIITHNLGMAASCGSLILTFGDKIAIEDLSITMFHNAIHGGKDSLHKAKVQVDHTVNRVALIFKRLISRGIITKDEATRIVDHGDEFFIPSNIIISRLKENNLLYEGEL
jgi:ATP-dependent protease ClpP protease subunit